MGSPSQRLGLTAALTLALAACGGSESRSRAEGAGCGIAYVAGPTQLLNEFSVPQQTLAAPPAELPERLVVRLAAGPVYSAVVGRADSLLVIGVEGTLPADVKAGFGVLVMEPGDRARGLMLFPGRAVEAAPTIGSVTMGDTTVPLIGIEVPAANYEDPNCPFFPDSAPQ